MKLLFIQQYIFEALGPMYISGALKRAGHDCVLLIARLEKDLLLKVAQEKPDIIGFQVFTGQHQWALEVAGKLKKMIDIPILFGGAHPTHNPEIINRPEVDCICRGEGEQAIVELLNGAKNIQNIWTKTQRNDVRPLIDLDTLPFPDRQLYYSYRQLSDNSIKRFSSSRGCPYHCTFCHNHMDIELYKGKGKWARKMSPERVIADIQRVRSEYPLKIVDFGPDDYFLSDRDWSFKFLELYAKQVHLPFSLNTRPESIDLDICYALEKANCRGVSVSIESAVDELRNKVLRKGTDLADIIKAVDLLQYVGIRVKTYNMIGIPGETIDQALETLDLNIILNPTWARCAIISPYPNTELWAKVKDNDISIDDFSDTYTDESMLKGKDEFINLQRFFALTVAFPWILPLVKRLIKQKRNKWFDRAGRLIFGFYACRYWGYSIKDILRYGWYFLKTGQPI
jgi:anaerobic magnesium-protoporphyrin IX monomethyl ester cyclase